MQATAADSVGVKTPLRMPPRMMKTVSRPQNASTAICSARRGGTTSPFGKFCRRAMMRHRSHQRQPEQEAGDDAGEEQVGDRDRAAGGERIDDGVVRRRNEQRLQRAGRP